VKSVPFVSATTGRMRATSIIVSAKSESMKTSPPVIPTEPKPSSLASAAARVIVSRVSARRAAIRGWDSVRQ
jgi:hypothetical protein